MHKLPHYLVAIAAVLIMCALSVSPSADTAAMPNIAAMLKATGAMALAIPAAVVESLGAYTNGPEY